MNRLQYITDTVNAYPDHQVEFSDPLQIKLSPHTMPFTVWGLWGGSDGVYVLDGGGNWHGPLLESQINAEFMINSIYQRLKVLPPPVSVVVAQYDEQVNATIFE
jgi:hypothetical protein